MKIKIVLYGCLIVGILLIAYIYEFQVFQKNTDLSADKGITFKVNGPEKFKSSYGGIYDMYTNSRMTTTNFIFQDSNGDIVTTLSIDNQFIGPPTYRVIKGKNHDWLIVTRQGMTGTSIKNLYDEWYSIDNNPKVVLDYESDGYEVPGPNQESKYWKAEIINNLVDDDSKVEVKTMYKTCMADNNTIDKDCKDDSRIDTYVWDAEKEVFRSRL